MTLHELYTTVPQAINSKVKLGMTYVFYISKI